MTIKINGKEFSFDRYAQLLRSIQQLVEECYTQGRADMFEELKPKADMIAYQQGRADAIDEFVKFLIDHAISYDNPQKESLVEWICRMAELLKEQTNG